MNRGFWTKLPRPFFAIAPMADVTDAPFRSIIAKYGKPDVMWTEFVAADGLVSRGKEKLLPLLNFAENERPIVAQLFSSNPEKMLEAAKLIQELKFDGIDINMGCPDRKVEKQNAGAAMIKNPELAKMIIRAAKEGAGKLPVSVKTRLGYNQVSIDTWLPHLLEEHPAAITIHGRTRKEMSKVPAHWDLIGHAAELAEKLCGKNRPLIIGNGDVKDLQQGVLLARKYGLDGIMIGRGVFGNPWLFKDVEKIRDTKNLKKYSPVMITPRKKLQALKEHMDRFEKFFANRNRFDVMKKHFKAYVSGFEGSKDLRDKLMQIKTSAEAKVLIENFLSQT